MRTKYTFREAITILMQGEAIKLPEWEGYWFQDGATKDPKAMSRTGEISDKPDFARYAHRDDWVTLDSNELMIINRRIESRLIDEKEHS